MSTTQNSVSKPFTYWVKLFHSYNQNATNKKERLKAITNLWNEWEKQDHKYKHSVNNPIALFFTVTNYVPNRVDNKGANIGQPGTRIIKWNDAPIYDTWANYRAGLVPWTCIDWVSYHKALKTHYRDLPKANNIWKTEWADRDNSCFILGSFICPDTSKCRYNCNFVEYFASQGIKIGNVLSNSVCNISNVVTDLTASASNITSGIRTTTNVVGAVAPFAIGTFLFLWGNNKFKKATNEK